MSLFRSAGLIGIGTMTSRVLGLVRDQVLAFFFGAADAMDAFRIAFRLPNVLRDLFAEGALSAALVPTFTRIFADGDAERAWRLASNIINLLLILSGVVVLAGMVFAGPLVGFYAAGFEAVPGKLDLTIRLTRLMFPFVAMVWVAAAFMALLNARRRFFVPALSPAMFNIATIACAVILVPLFGRYGIEPVVAIAIGALVGGLGQVLLQWPAVRREGFRYTALLDLRDPGLRQVGRLMVPGIAGLAAIQINLFVNSWLAAGLGTGAVSWLDYAFRLMYMPIGLFGVSIATASLPSISWHAASRDESGVRREISSALRTMLLLNVPATLGLIVLAPPIVALIFERGRFTPADTAATAAALACYAPGLIGYSAVKLASPAFYALGDSRTPLVAGGASVACNIGLNLLLVRSMGHRGLALGTAAAALLNSGILLWLLSARLRGLENSRLLTASLKIFVAAAAMAFAAFVTERALHVPWGGPDLAARAIRVFGAIGMGLIVLASAASLLRIEEFEQLKRRAFRSSGQGMD
jgi:putative peptidoglycan lipid II flippase